MVLFLTTINLNPLTCRITQAYHGYGLKLNRRLEIEAKENKIRGLKIIKHLFFSLKYFGQVFCCSYQG